MTLQLLLDQKNITKYHLSKISGVPKTTIIDICSGQSSIDRCSAKTVFQIAKALGCTMEDIMMLEEPKKYNAETGLPEDKSYLECGLPEYLKISLANMKKSWAIEYSGQRDYHWDHIGGHKYFSDFYVHSAEMDWLNGKFPLPLEIAKSGLTAVVE